ncbi:hypothetical protein TNCV_4170311 [Trichonephila clavipes]|nr:hypothetical protein TNCV_4170311 [Trichonephila clavipes]
MISESPLTLRSGYLLRFDFHLGFYFVVTVDDGCREFGVLIPCDFLWAVYWCHVDRLMHVKSLKGTEVWRVGQTLSSSFDRSSKKVRYS